MIRWEEDEEDDTILYGFLKDRIICQIDYHSYSENYCLDFAIDRPEFVDVLYASLDKAKEAAEERLTLFLKDTGLEIKDPYHGPLTAEEG